MGFAFNSVVEEIEVKEKRWTKEYEAHIQRNIGILTKDQQESIRKSKIVMMGMGGIGSPCYESLVRSGVENFSLVDRDKFDATNLNRQIFAFRSTLGKRKIDVAEQFAMDINPSIKIEKYDYVDENNIDEILLNADVIVQAIDEVKPWIVASRRARELKIPMVEGWALSCGNVRVFTENTISLEEAYELPTIGRNIEDFCEEEYRSMGLKAILGLAKRIEGVSDFCTEEVIEKIKRGINTSFGPMVWFTSAIMVMETIKLILDWGDIAYAPDFRLYDPIEHRIPRIVSK